MKVSKRGKPLSRLCPKCFEEIIYATPYSCRKFTEKNSLCIKCTNRDKAKNPEYGKKISRSKMGHTVSEETKQKISLAKLGQRHSEKSKKLMSEHSARYWKGKRPDAAIQASVRVNKNRKMTEDERAMRRDVMIRSIESRYRKNIFPSYNSAACKIFEEINFQLEWAGQHAENGGEFRIDGYWVDYYESTKNVVIEYDESYHQTLSQHKKDVRRQRRIQKILGCVFLRIKEGQSWREVLNAYLL